MIEIGNVEHGRAIARAAGTFFNPECDIVIANTEDGKLLGGVTYTSFRTVSICMHMAGIEPRWINREGLWFAFHYPFEQLGVRKIIATIPSGNLKAISLNRKLGFVEETRIADALLDGDLLIMAMRKENCRWLIRGHRGR